MCILSAFRGCFLIHPLTQKDSLEASSGTKSIAKNPKIGFACGHGKWTNYDSSHGNPEECAFCKHLEYLKSVSFERHPKGIGMKLLSKMGYSRRGLEIRKQGIINPIEVKERSCYQGLGYGETRESSKAFKKENSLVNTSDYSSGSEYNSSPKKESKRKDEA
ncbi:hypothetical protein SUGI_0532590 [Cryptomeria japonica]|nr:hypothetical protein SUGI_0532590 [Cryptomeria japonica]